MGTFTTHSRYAVDGGHLCPSPLAVAWLVHADTGDPEIDERVCAWASALCVTG
ncbi:MAG: hypothetical protein ABI187_03650 [Ornithinibacter sp.]